MSRYLVLKSHFKVILYRVISHFVVLYKSRVQLQELLHCSEMSVQIQ
jgi:hypothetical protein